MMFQRLTVVILAVVAAFTYQGCGGGSSGGGAPPPPLTMAVVSGDNLTQSEGTTIDIVVSVTDQSGSPVIGAVVDFDATFPDGTSQQLSFTMTGPTTTLVFGLNTGPGVYSISMVATFNTDTSNTLNFIETATAAPTSISLPLAQTSGNGQTGPGAGTIVGVSLIGPPPASTLPNALIVTVVDQSNNPVGGATVTFTLSQPTSGNGFMQGQVEPFDAIKPSFTLSPVGSGTLVTVTTDSAGIAGIYLVPGVGPLSGANTVDVTATLGALTTLTLQFTATGT